MSNKVRVYKIILQVIDYNQEFDNLSIKNHLENLDDIVLIKVRNLKYKEVDWSDDHPLNQINCKPEVFEKMFKE